MTEGSGEFVEQRGRRRHREAGGSEAGGGAFYAVGVMREVDAHADHQRFANAFEQDAGAFGAVQQHVVGPFEGEARWLAGERRQRIMQGERGDEAELLDLTGRLDQHAAHEIAGTIVPHPAPAAAPSSLAIGDHPMAIGQRLGAGQQPIVGGTDLCEVGEAAQAGNSAAAARAVAATSGEIASMPMGEQNKAQAAIMAPLTLLPSVASGTAGSSKYLILMRRR